MLVDDSVPPATDIRVHVDIRKFDSLFVALDDAYIRMFDSLFVALDGVTEDAGGPRRRTGGAGRQHKKQTHSQNRGCLSRKSFA